MAQQCQKQNASLAMGTQMGETVSLSCSHLKGGVVPNRSPESFTHHLRKINPPNCCPYFIATCVAFTVTHPPPAQSVRCEEVMEGRMHD